MQQAELRIAGRGTRRLGVYAILVETPQDLLQLWAAINGGRQTIVDRRIRLPIFVESTVVTTGTMLTGSEIGAALELPGADAVGLICATVPDEMSEYLSHLQRRDRLPN